LPTTNEASSGGCCDQLTDVLEYLVPSIMHTILCLHALVVTTAELVPAIQIKQTNRVQFELVMIQFIRAIHELESIPKSAAREAAAELELLLDNNNDVRIRALVVLRTESCSACPNPCLGSCDSRTKDS